MRFYITLLFFLSGGITGISAQTTDHWETVVDGATLSAYFPGYTAPNDSWKELAFDDDTWNKGYASLGYGDNDDLTVVDQVLTVYTRAEFTIFDMNAVTALLLAMDYDDAFVAYLNGTEVARSNIGTIGVEPAYDDRADSNHEAMIYQGYNPELFLIEPFIWATALKEGKNVLAIQTHNVDPNSSDLTSHPNLLIGSSSNEVLYKSTPDWFNAPLEFTSSNLPILIIDTEGGVGIVDEPKVDATLKIVDNENGQENNIHGPYHEDSGPIGIEIRGNVTQSFPKKPYIFETRDAEGNNRNIELLGMPSENDWILKACYLDKTLMRNAIASEMSRSMGQYAPRYRFCEVVLNGQYDGVYMLMEKIKRDKNRVDIAKLEPTTTEHDSITGGYIYQVSQDYAHLGNRRSLIYPDPDDANATQKNYIRDYDDQFRATMNSSYFDHQIYGYPYWIDVPSFIDEIIVQEACKNSDAYGWSSYFYKDRGDKLKAGPVWDFDQALSNSTFNSGSNYAEWIITKYNSDVPAFWNKLFQEKMFKYLLKERWFDLRQNALHTDTLLAFIDQTAALLSEGAQQRNFERWPVLGRQLWRSLPGWYDRDTYEKEVDYMKEFLVAHLDWMDQELSEVFDQQIDVPELVISEIMYAPAEGQDLEFIELVNPGTESVNLGGLNFTRGISYIFPNQQFIHPGRFVVLASDSLKFYQKYGFPPFGEFSGNLDNSGERVVLANSYGMLVDEVRFNDKEPWPVVEENNPRSIELIDNYSDNNLPENWSLSSKTEGTPMYQLETGVDVEKDFHEIKLYPNPTSGDLYIAIGVFQGKMATVSVYNLTGSCLYQIQLSDGDQEIYALDLSFLQAGTYLLRLSTESVHTVKRFVVVK